METYQEPARGVAGDPSGPIVNNAHVDATMYGPLSWCYQLLWCREREVAKFGTKSSVVLYTSPGGQQKQSIEPLFRAGSAGS